MAGPDGDRRWQWTGFAVLLVLGVAVVVTAVWSIVDERLEMWIPIALFAILLSAMGILSAARWRSPIRKSR